MKNSAITIFLTVLVLSVTFTGCGPKILSPDRLTAPDPIEGNTGEFLCPYTTDDTLCEWVDKGVAARFSSSLGSVAGREVGARALGAIPIVGGFIGQKTGEFAARKIAIKCCGGWDAIRASSDQSFEKVEDLALWMYVTHSFDENYDKVLRLTMEIYPKLQKKYSKALAQASKNAMKS